MGMSMTAEQAKAARAAAQQTQAQQTGKPVDWNSNVSVPDNSRQNQNRKGGGGPGKGGASQPGGANITQPAVPYNPLFPGKDSSASPVPLPMAGGMPVGGGQAPMSAQAAEAQMPVVAPPPPQYPGIPTNMGAGYQGLINGRIDTAFNAGIPQNQLASYLAQGFGNPGQGQGLNLGPGTPPPPDGRGGGGGHHGAVPGGSTPQDLAALLAAVAQFKGGQIFDMPGNVQQILETNGKGAMFAQILQQMGFRNAGRIGPGGFPVSFFVPQGFSMTPEMMNLLSMLQPDDASTLQQLLSGLFGGAPTDTSQTTSPDQAAPTPPWATTMPIDQQGQPKQAPTSGVPQMPTGPSIQIPGLPTG